MLGYGGLSWEIVEYLRGLLDKYSNVDEYEDGYFAVERVVDLFNRLFNFYVEWCDGKFIDDHKVILPHLKMIELIPYVSAEANLGQRQVDVLTGLNVMILLLELHRYGVDSGNEELQKQLNFHPCGEVDKNGKPKDIDLLLRIIGYSHCLGVTGFIYTVGNFLYKANLNNAYLNNANLYNANLYNTNLNNAYLYNANLNNAHLYNTNLYKAHLYKAHLNNAHLYNAHLYNANLYNVNLEDANLYNANLEDANLKDANLENITWNEETNWEGVRGLEKAINVPEELKRQLGI